MKGRRGPGAGGSRAKRGVPAAEVQRTSIDFPRELHRRVRIAAIERGITLRDYVVLALEEQLRGTA